MSDTIDTPSFGDLIRKVLDLKAKMHSRGLDVAVATCPRCGTKGTFLLRLAGPKKHVHGVCRAVDCTFRVME